MPDQVETPLTMSQIQEDPGASSLLRLKTVRGLVTTTPMMSTMRMRKRGNGIPAERAKSSIGVAELDRIQMQSNMTTTQCRQVFRLKNIHRPLISTRQWARERRQADSERDGDFGPEDYFDGAIRGGYRGEEEVDDFAETMLLVVLCLTVSALIYLRGRWVERMRRDQEGQQQQQNAQGNGVPEFAQPPQGGLFPRPGDPAREDWGILR